MGPKNHLRLYTKSRLVDGISYDPPSFLAGQYIYFNCYCIPVFIF
jgi:hypothetical protein